MRKLFAQYGLAILATILIMCIVALLFVPNSPMNVMELYGRNAEIKAPVGKENGAIDTVYNKERPVISFDGAQTIKKSGVAYDLEASFSATCASDASIQSVKVTRVTKNRGEENLIGTLNKVDAFKFPSSDIYFITVEAMDTQKRIQSQVFRLPIN